MLAANGETSQWRREFLVNTPDCYNFLVFVRGGGREEKKLALFRNQKRSSKKKEGLRVG